MMIAISSVHSPFTVGRPRRSSLWSTESSWMSAAACTISTTVAHRTASSAEVAAQPGDQQQQRGAELLAAGGEHVPADLVQDRNRGAEELPEMGLHPLQLAPHRLLHRGHRHASGFMRGGKAWPYSFAGRRGYGRATKGVKPRRALARGPRRSREAHRAGARACCARDRRAPPRAAPRASRPPPGPGGMPSSRITSRPSTARSATRERARFREQPLDPRAHLLEVDREPLLEAVAEHVGDPQVEQIRHRLRPDVR